MDIKRNSLIALALVSVLALTGVSCDSDDNDEWGRISLAITDSPVDSAARVVVEFTAVEIQPADGQRELFQFSSPRQIDLLALHGGESELLLDDALLPPGNYNFILLHVNAGIDESDSFIELDDGSMYPLFIPSGNQQGLRLVRGFTLAQGGAVDFTIDFDLRKSVIGPPGLMGPYILRPTLRLVDNSEVGAIAGTVDGSLIDETCDPAVYVYTGQGITPTDMQEDSGPLASSLVEMDTEGQFVYRVAFLEEDDYTVAFTCEAGEDEALTAEDIAFIGGTADATVVADTTTTVDFPVAN